uniref:Endonuclease/exonuclease/phosphatase domain-containing protein n=1 Tax=Spongospora subterranea TaxID=70186 RepID=A0A0H5R271_9EUKA|eukprot:CRZ01969.1 hypothetical protein [Spongospora subterranea]
MWWMLNRLYRDIAFVKNRGAFRHETSTGTRRVSTEDDDGLTGDYSIRILTLNVWGLYFLSHVEKRIDAICRKLDGYDVVALQEVWHSRERDVLRDAARSYGMIYAHYFACGVGAPFWPGSHGTGLLILSKLPIDDVIWKRFLVNGKPYKLHHSDYLAGRGVGLLRLSSPCGPIDFYVTHLHAMYAHTPEDDEYQAHRVGQAFEAAQFIRATARAPLVLVLGDFNCWPNSVPMDLMRQFVRLKDGWENCNAGDVEKPGAGCTFGASDNCFSFKSNVPPERLDYILYVMLSTPHRRAGIRWAIRECSVVTDFMDDSEKGQLPLSDHWGVQAVFTGAKSDSSPNFGKLPVDVLQWPLDEVSQMDWGLMKKAVNICISGRKEADCRRSNHHKRAVFALLLFPLLWVMGVDIPDVFSFAPFLVSGYAFVEMLLAQGVVTDEITAFSEILHQMRHHLRASERIGSSLDVDL